MGAPVSDDVVALMVKIAWKAHERGDLSHAQLCDVLKDAVNMRALENGYADKYGMPFPVRRRRRR